MIDNDYKKIVKKYIKDNLLKSFDACTIFRENDYVFQDNKYNTLNVDNTTYKIESINTEYAEIEISNVNNKLYPLTNKKIYVNYNFEVEIDSGYENTLKLKNPNDIYLLSVGDIISENVNKLSNKIYVIVDIDDVIVNNPYMTATHDNQEFTVNIFIGSNDYNGNEEKFEFFFNEILKLMRVQSFQVEYKGLKMNIFTKTKPRYKTGIKTENDRVGYIILTLSHFFNFKNRL